MKIASFEDLKASRKEAVLKSGGTRWRTEFFLPTETDRVQAFLAESTPHRHLRTHCHNVDQFQVVMSGGGTIGRHKLAPGAVHFARAYTAYGPIVNGDDGLAFFTLRRQKATETLNIPQDAERLKAIVDRKPGQFTALPVFTAISGSVDIQPIEGMKDDCGLAGHTVTMSSDASAIAPEPRGSDGQFIVVLTGSLIHDGRELTAPALAFLTPDDPAFHLQAGTKGLTALVLNFPAPNQSTRSSSKEHL